MTAPRSLAQGQIGIQRFAAAVRHEEESAAVRGLLKMSRVLSVR